VVVGFPLRVTRICEFVRQRLDEGAVGRREHVLGVNYVPYGSIYFEGGYRDYDVTRGLFLQKATHDLDAIDSLMDSPVVRVAAMHNRGRVFGGNRPADLRCSDCDDAPTCPESPRNRVRNRSGDAHDHLCVFSEAAGDPESGMNEDSSSCLMEFASGAHGVYTQIFFARRDAAARGATVSGYDGTLSFDWPSSEARYVRHHAPFSDTIRMEEGGAHFGGDEELAADFLGLLRGRQKTVRTPIETGLRSVYTCLACQKSAETGRFVDVRQVGF
jgi:predicted dehydrogenase